MLRKVKAYKRFLTPMFLILLMSVSFFVPIQPPSNAQTNFCPGNLVTNGDFSNGLVAGPLPGGGAVSNWTRAYGSPDVALAGHDPGSVGMWGNLNTTIGEGLQQNLGPNALQTGKTYLVSLWVRWVNDPNDPKQSYAKFKVRASTAPLTSAAGGLTVGLTGNITSQTWQQVIFPAWTAPSGGPFPFLTISVENNSSNNNGLYTSYGAVDDICIQEMDFPVPNSCQGKPTAFTSSVAGATSWNWNFGDGFTATQQNPTHTYASAGTFNVTLCVNGTTNCVTKPITVNPSPPPPVITGPASSCGLLTATYSVPPASGVSYSWSVSNGTINGSTTGSSVSVNWNATGTGSISVTVTNQAGCSSSTRMVVSCDLGLECCLNTKYQTDLMSFVHLGGGVYNFTATLSTSQTPIVRVTANIISSSVTYSSPKCGVSGPANSYMMSPQIAGGLTPSIPVVNGHEVIWHSPPTSISGVNFPMQIHFPPPPKGSCRDSLTFCVKYTFTDRNCKTCEVIRCYGPFKRGGPPPNLDDSKDKKVAP